MKNFIFGTPSLTLTSQLPRRHVETQIHKGPKDNLEILEQAVKEICCRSREDKKKGGLDVSV